MHFLTESDASPPAQLSSHEPLELRYLVKTRAYELALVCASQGPPVVHVRFSGQRSSLVLTLAELEAFYVTVGHLRDYLIREGVRCPSPPPSARGVQGSPSSSAP